jgi:hypothetical protein
MDDSSKTVGWIVIVLLAIAAIIANTLIPRQMQMGELEEGMLSIILFMTLLVICGVLALRYKWRD